MKEKKNKFTMEKPLFHYTLILICSTFYFLCSREIGIETISLMTEKFSTPKKNSRRHLCVAPTIKNLEYLKKYRQSNVDINNTSTIYLL